MFMLPVVGMNEVLTFKTINPQSISKNKGASARLCLGCSIVYISVPGLFSIRVWQSICRSTVRHEDSPMLLATRRTTKRGLPESRNENDTPSLAKLMD